MRITLALAVSALCAVRSAAQLPRQQLRMLAIDGQEPALREAVRASPDDARELIRRLLVEAGAADPPQSERVVTLASRLAESYAAVWEDSFPLRTVARFSEMSPAHRRAKLAADSMRRSGNTALGRAGVKAAFPLWRDALRRATAMSDTAGVAAALGNLGAGFFRLGQLDSARSYLERSHQLAEGIGDRRTALNALGTLGSVARDAGDLRRAQTLYSRALELRGRIGDNRGAAADHNNLGLLAAELGDRVEALAHYNEALALARRHALTEPEAVALTNLGNAASAVGDFVQASKLYSEALARYRAAGSDEDAAFVLHNLGLLEMRRGRFGAAEGKLRSALAIYSRDAAVADIARTRRDLSVLAVATGNPQRALEQLRLAERVLGRAPPNHELLAAIALARADAAVELNELTESERQYARAAALYARAGDGQGQSEARQGLAVLLIERERYDEALEQLQLVVRAQTTLDDRRPAAFARILVGQTMLRRGDLTNARSELDVALDSLRALGDPIGEALAVGALGDLELQAGAPVAAEALYRRGLARIEKTPTPAVSWELHAALGQVLRARRALDEAAKELGAAIGDVEGMAGTLLLPERRTSFLADKWEPYATLAIVERERGDFAASFAATERMRSRQMLDLLARGRVSAPVSADTALLEAEQDLRRQITELTRRLELEESRLGLLRGPELGGSSTGLTREALARTQQRYAQLLLELREGAAGYLPLVPDGIAAWQAIAGRLAEDEALIEYLVTDSTTMAFVIRADTIRVLDLGVGRGALAPLVDFARGTVEHPSQATRSPWRAPLRRLHALLFEPIEASGSLAGVRRLVIVPSAELHYLPFAALLSADGKRFLIERYEIAFTPSASVWLRLGDRLRESPPRKVLALAPLAGALPGSRAEVEAIGKLYGREATVLVGESATESAFRAEAARYEIVHVATYGVLNKHNPLFSFVALNPAPSSDGRLEVHEVFGLSLNARLLVLSACQTGLASGAVSDVPAGDEWVGLVRAFLGAGVHNVIATLWAVEDRSTATLMVNLHRELLAKRSESAALALAQRDMLRNPATSDPFYWAGFVLVGGR